MVNGGGLRSVEMWITKQQLFIVLGREFESSVGSVDMLLRLLSIPNGPMFRSNFLFRVWRECFLMRVVESVLWKNQQFCLGAFEIHMGQLNIQRSIIFVKTVDKSCLNIDKQYI
ncbi:14839_t:CDS:1 [Funneliformis mosseae]|uniref:14839_t:CDS:1 n=1 Tax=Funneliformis mosseae TaxID=27381 RepID=A0A9N9E3U0_FUNMO|nr:14839_t:CDS:1 [Funneliformis mosseae]